MYWKEGFFVPHVPIITFKAIGTREEAFLYHFGAGRGRRDFHVTPQPASLTAPSGSGQRVQVGDFTKKGHPEFRMASGAENET